MTADVTMIKIQMEQADRLEVEGRKLIERAEIARGLARNSCPHPARRSEAEYIDGTDYNKARTRTTWYCAVCGKELKTDTEIHPYDG